MGVYGLWRLLDATGKPVPLETLEGKVLAVDVSIWIHQVMQGYQDRHGHSKPNAHLLGLFNRICKLLYYKIKPVFIFDGGVPMLKKNTIASRRKQKAIATSKAQKMKTELIHNLIKHSAVKSVLSKDANDGETGSSNIPPTFQDKPAIHDMFKLPDLLTTNITELSPSDESDSDSSIDLSPRKQKKWMGNIHNVDVVSAEFKALPADVRYDILTDLKETRKQNSWGRLHEMPEKSHDFSSFQMKRLLKRRLVQESLETAEKEMGGKTLTLEELEKLLTEQGISTKGRDDAFRIAADSTTRLIYISDKNALTKGTMEDTNINEKDTSNESKDIEPIAGPSKLLPILEDINEYELHDNWCSDIELMSSNDVTPQMDSTWEPEIDSDFDAGTELNESRPLAKKYFGKNTMNPALTYMMEYSGLTPKRILGLLEQNRSEGDTVKKGEKKEKEVSASEKDIVNDDRPCSTTTVRSKSEEMFDYISKRQPFKTSKKDDNVAASVILSNDNCELHSENKKDDCSSKKLSVGNVSESAAMSDTDSDSDDFIEIQDVPIPDTNNAKQSNLKKNMQITIRADQPIEDDMFADVFSAENNKLDLTECSQSTNQSGDIPKTQRETFRRVPLVSEESKVKPITIELDATQPALVLDTDIKKASTERTKATNIQTNLEPCQDEVDREVCGSPREITDLNEHPATAANVDDATTSGASADVAKPISPLPATEEQLQSLKAQLEGEQEVLSANIGKLERQATDISDQIRIEAQELLRLFGLPYIVAPMEAEAQCAYLEKIRLTDGTITDDSDIWLFGGQCVYKNFFNNNRVVLQFRACDIEHHFKLTRNELIQLALLVGSDYTMGLTGIGPVTALEILAVFPAHADNLLHGLTSFCSWVRAGKTAGPGKTGLRTKLKNVKIDKGFPSQAVAQAYLFPTIDESKEAFTWGKPNVMLLADYARLKFGWTNAKFQEIINPVLKRLGQRQNQKPIESYFKVHTVPKDIETQLSKRVQKAVRRLNQDSVPEDNLEENSDAREAKLRRKKGRTKCSNTKERDETEEKMGKMEETEKTEQTEKTEKPDTPEKDLDGTIPSVQIKPRISAVNKNQNKNEYIPQREKDKAESLKKKLHAIEVLRKSKHGLYKTRKVKRYIRKIKKEAELSESDSSSS